MATVILRNAKILVDGFDVSGDLNRVALDYAIETKDATVIGDDTRRNKGGLATTKMSVSGFVQYGTGLIDETVFSRIGTDDIVVSVYPDQVTEGSMSTGSGYAFKALEAEYRPGGRIGDMLAFDLTVEGRGIEA